MQTSQDYRYSINNWEKPYPNGFLGKVWVRGKSLGIIYLNIGSLTLTQNIYYPLRKVQSVTATFALSTIDGV